VLDQDLRASRQRHQLVWRCAGKDSGRHAGIYNASTPFKSPSEGPQRLKVPASSAIPIFIDTYMMSKALGRNGRRRWATPSVFGSVAIVRNRAVTTAAENNPTRSYVFRPPRHRPAERIIADEHSSFPRCWPSSKRGGRGPRGLSADDPALLKKARGREAAQMEERELLGTSMRADPRWRRPKGGRACESCRFGTTAPFPGRGETGVFFLSGTSTGPEIFRDMIQKRTRGVIA